VLDALTYSGNRENLNAVAKDSRLSFGEGDVTDARLVDDLMPGHDLVLVGAESDVDQSITGKRSAPCS
jgi:dTDP-glucose 4,6-dehydratase